MSRDRPSLSAHSVPGDLEINKRSALVVVYRNLSHHNSVLILITIMYFYCMYNKKDVRWRAARRETEKTFSKRGLKVTSEPDDKMNSQIH